MKHIRFPLLAASLLLSGCIGTPTKPSDFYVLNSYPGTPVTTSATRGTPLSIELGPVILPELYERPQIVTRSDSNRIRLAEFDRWGGDLRKDLERILARNLMTRLATDSITPYPWHARIRPDFQVTMQLFRFDGEPGEDVELQGAWRILDGVGGCELETANFSIVQATGGPGYPALVSAMSRSIANLSQQLAERIVAINPGCPADTAQR
jgi:hypothetical protein